MKEMFEEIKDMWKNDHFVLLFTTNFRRIK